MAASSELFFYTRCAAMLVLAGKQHRVSLGVPTYDALIFAGTTLQKFVLF